MAEKSFQTANIALYGVAIGDALSGLANGQRSIDDVIQLRDQVKLIVDAQGDLVAALKDLNIEIERRGAVQAEPPSERFVAQIDGLAMPAKLRADICQALQKAVLAEVAKLDSGGDMIATPLSELRTFGSGVGSSTGGVAIVARYHNKR
jgi:hypothetical protein